MAEMTVQEIINFLADNPIIISLEKRFDGTEKSLSFYPLARFYRVALHSGGTEKVVYTSPSIDHTMLARGLSITTITDMAVKKYNQY